MHGLRVGFTLIATGLIFISCGNKHISLPQEFRIDSKVYLGQDMSTLHKERNLKPIDSDPGYSEDLVNNKYFNAIGYNPEIMDWFGRSPGSLKVIGLYSGRLSEADSLTDNMAHEIINICDRYYGQHRVVPDSLGGDKSPWYIWVTDSCTAYFIYLSSERYEELRRENERAIAGYGLKIGYNLDEINELLNRRKLK
jgi:hypothetical protein